MATPAQILANQVNAAASTGPRTVAGKSRSAQNAVTLGLFSLRNIVQRGEEEQYAFLTATLWEELQPAGPCEEIQAAEIVRAAWRLQRIANAEATLGDIEGNPDDSAPEPVLNPATAHTQAAIDRARQQTQRAHHRATTELRRLQSERRIRRETLSAKINTRGQRADARLPMRPEYARAKRTQSEPAAPVQFSRNARCNCGSGLKFKRCCGQNAAPILTRAA